MRSKGELTSFEFEVELFEPGQPQGGITSIGSLLFCAEFVLIVSDLS